MFSTQTSKKEQPPLLIDFSQEVSFKPYTRMMFLSLVKQMTYGDNPITDFQANTTYPITIGKGSAAEHTRTIMFSHRIILQTYQDNDYFEVIDHIIGEKKEGVKYLLQGKIYFDLTQSTLKYEKVQNSYGIHCHELDVFNLEPHQENFLSKIICFGMNNGVKYFNYSTTHTLTIDNNVTEYLHLNLTYPLFVRPREHDDTQMRFEVLTDLLGEGCYGEVYRLATFAMSTDYQFQKRHENYIVKIQDDDAKSSQSVNADQEAQYLKSFNDRSSKKVVRAMVDGVPSTLHVSRFIEGVTLKEELKKHRTDVFALSTNQRLWQSKMITASALEFQQLRLIHRDIKPENIMSSAESVKLIDLGFTHSEDAPHAREGCGSLQYAAPEVWKKEKVGKETDVFSVGATLGELLDAEYPTFSKDDAKNFACNYVFKNIFSRMKDLSKAHQDEILTMLNAMMRTKQEDRIDLMDCYEILDKIIMEIKILDLEEDERIHIPAIYKAQEIAMAVKRILFPLGLVKLTHTQAQQIKSVFRLAHEITSPFAVEQFIQTLGIKAIQGLTTIKAITEKVNEIVDTFDHQFNRLIQLRSQLAILRRAINEGKVKTLTIPEVHAVSLEVHNWFQRCSPLALTLDNMAYLNSKFNKKLRFEQLVLEVKEMTRIHMPVIDTMAQTTLFATADSVMHTRALPTAATKFYF